jgi:hypothetical protein
MQGEQTSADQEAQEESDSGSTSPVINVGRLIRSHLSHQQADQSSAAIASVQVALNLELDKLGWFKFDS